MLYIKKKAHTCRIHQLYKQELQLYTTVTFHLPHYVTHISCVLQSSGTWPHFKLLNKILWIPCSSQLPPKYRRAQACTTLPNVWKTAIRTSSEGRSGNWLSFWLNQRQGSPSRWMVSGLSPGTVSFMSLASRKKESQSWRVGKSTLFSTARTFGTEGRKRLI